MTVAGALELKLITLRKLKGFFFWAGGGIFFLEWNIFLFFFSPPSLAQKEANSTVLFITCEFWLVFTVAASISGKKEKSFVCLR